MDILTTLRPKLALQRRARSLWSFDGRHEGQGLIEYGLVIILVAIAAFSSIEFLGVGVDSFYEFIASGLPF